MEMGSLMGIDFGSCINIDECRKVAGSLPIIVSKEHTYEIRLFRKTDNP